MSEHDAEAAEIAQVLAKPDDDEPRRRLAEQWLAAGNVRGEFVELQLRLAEMPRWHPERPTLRTRERDLLASHRDAWLAELPLGQLNGQFHRGFVSSVDGRAAELGKQLPVLSKLAPVTGIELCIDEEDQGPDPSLLQLLDVEALRRIRRLSLAEGDVLPDRWQMLLTHEAWQQLESIELGEPMCEPEIAVAMAHSRLPASLRQLRFEGHMGGFGDAGGVEIARAPWLTQLDLLTLNGQTLGDDTLRALAASNARPRVLGLSSAGYGENTFSSDTLRSLADAPLLEQLQSLSLVGAPVGEALPDVLPRMRQLRSASLTRTGIDADDLRLLVRQSTFVDWQHLSLGSNPIGDHGARMLAMCHQLPRVLELTNCDITAVGLRELASIPAIDALDLRNNPLPAEAWQRQLRDGRLPKATALLCDARNWPAELLTAIREHYPRTDLIGADTCR